MAKFPTIEWKRQFWKRSFELKCLSAIQKKVNVSGISHEKARVLLIEWLEKESELKIRGVELSVEEHHALVMLMHRRGLTT